MSPVSAAVEEARIDEWNAESARIELLSHEVARFRFSRSMEYAQRREGISERAAFKQTVENAARYFFEDSDGDWDYACYSLGLPYSDAPKLKEFWEAED